MEIYNNNDNMKIWLMEWVYFQTVLKVLSSNV